MRHAAKLNWLVIFGLLVKFLIHFLISDPFEIQLHAVDRSAVHCERQLDVTEGTYTQSFLCPPDLTVTSVSVSLPTTGPLSLCLYCRDIWWKRRFDHHNHGSSSQARTPENPFEGSMNANVRGAWLARLPWPHITLTIGFLISLNVVNSSRYNKIQQVSMFMLIHLNPSRCIAIF